jgi:DNA-binding response OmpR family regulator
VRIWKILYVENHPRFAVIVVRRFLAAHQVTLVPGLEEARAALARERFDVVLLDYDLDDGKGVVLVEELRRQAGRPLLIAASSHAEGNERLLQAGVDAACGKMDFARIEELLCAYLDGRAS